jgi:Na+/H+-dicarboxylate symporter
MVTRLAPLAAVSVMAYTIGHFGLRALSRLDVLLA